MRADLEVAVGRIAVGASLRAERRSSHRLALIAATALTLPFMAVLMLNSLTQAHLLGPGLIGSLLGSRPADHTLERALTLGPPLALLVVAASCIRVHVTRSDGNWSARAEAVFSPFELGVAFVALTVAGMFFGHLVADGLACSLGRVSAC
jgi:hypothetical protein